MEYPSVDDNLHVIRNVEFRLVLSFSLAVLGDNLPGARVAVGELLHRESLAIAVLPDAVLVAVVKDGLAVVEPGEFGLGHAVVPHRHLNLTTRQL